MNTTPPTTHAAAAAALRGTEPIRGLTVRQPWTSAIAHLDKRIENRARVTTFTGWLMIHAGLQPDRVHWQLADIAALNEPVPATGALYLWTPTQDLRQAVAAELTR